jgi:hypothetical protein
MKPIKRTPRPTTLAQAEQNAGRIDATIYYIRHALACAKLGRANKTAARLRLALSSALGAKRNGGYVVTRLHHCATCNTSPCFDNNHG